MSEVKDVRAALERLSQRDTAALPPDLLWDDLVLRALVSEGLAACDEYDDDQFDNINWIEVRVFASILRKAGLL